MDQDILFKDLRKVILTGKSSFMVIIPKNAAKLIALEKGDYFHLELLKDGNIMLRHNISPFERKRRLEIGDRTKDLY
jgi:phosphate uptake regulator